MRGFPLAKQRTIRLCLLYIKLICVWQATVSFKKPCDLTARIRASSSPLTFFRKRVQMTAQSLQWAISRRRHLSRNGPYHTSISCPYHLFMLSHKVGLVIFALATCALLFCQHTDNAHVLSLDPRPTSNCQEAASLWKSCFADIGYVNYLLNWHDWPQHGQHAFACIRDSNYLFHLVR